MKVLGLVGILLVTAACNNTAPTATTYKEQLGAPAAVAGNNNTGNANGGAVDPAAGQAALAASCASCHVEGGVGRVLTANEADSIAKSGPVTSQPSFHTSLSDTFAKDGANMAAYLKGGATGGGDAPAAGAGDAAKGNALLTGTCGACHGVSAVALDSFANLEGQDQDTAAHHPANIRTAIKDNRADLEAAIKALP
ncbi:c-type cytochrome [Oligoflexus tunisiensis]|uniref:c-type cytochrome n=1 Tax=Oligoflexus tunisiensis TaxID=708132 RepID=UPI00114D007B|nr:c-type cytochrome [Oligoflexus tunisiensis]